MYVCTGFELALSLTVCECVYVYVGLDRICGGILLRVFPHVAWGVSNRMGGVRSLLFLFLSMKQSGLIANKRGT